MVKNALAKTYWSIAWPAALEGLFVVMLSSVDLMMISTLDLSAVAAVGIFDQPKLIMLCFSRSISVAVMALVSMRHGAKEDNQIPGVLKQSLTLTLLGALILMVGSLIWMPEILTFAGAKSDYLQLALNYSNLVTISLVFNGITQVLNAGLVGIGITKPMLVSNVAGNAVNIVLNALFIYVLKWSVTGAALGTLIGSMVSCGLSWNYVRKSTIAINSRGHWLPRKDNVTAIGKLFGGAFTEQGMERVGMFAYSKLVADLGTAVFATHNICMTLCNVFYTFGQGFGSASLAMAGNAIGGGRQSEIPKIAKIALVIGTAFSLVAAGVYFAFRTPLVALFAEDMGAVELGSQIMIFVAITCIPQTISLAFSGILRGMGRTAYVAGYSFAIIAVFRPILTWLLAYHFGLGLHGAWIALLTDQTLRMTCASFGILPRKTKNGAGHLEKRSVLR